MAELKWGNISTGPTFEALATALVFFEEDSATLFGRPGKDGGQDVRSGDRVFQAKYNNTGSAAKAISDAKKEAKKIASYRQPQQQKAAPGPKGKRKAVSQSRLKQWEGIENWRLVTNAAFNPTDAQIWVEEVVPIFKKLELSADYWAQADIETRLLKHPEIARAFFHNETRVFLTLPEIREQLPEREPFLHRKELGVFAGRKMEIREIREFLKGSARFLVVFGPGGIGKTRFLIEAGQQVRSEGVFQVLWANVATLAESSNWFDAIVPEQPTLLLIDEPDDEKLLRQLTEQLSVRVGRTAKWKVVIAVRAPKDPVLRFLRQPRITSQVQELRLSALSDLEATAMCSALLETSKAGLSRADRDGLAQKIARGLNNHPIWMTLAIRQWEEQGSLIQLPINAQQLAATYLAEIEGSQTEFGRDHIRGLLRWISLIGTINRMDDAALRYIGGQVGVTELPEVQKMISDLVHRGALVQRGARDRLVEVKPDVVRDFILLNWLTVDQGFGDRPIATSKEAKALISSVLAALDAGTIGALNRVTLDSIGRTELLLRLAGKVVPLLDSFFVGLHDRIPDLTCSRRISLVGLLSTIATLRPAETLKIIRQIRLNPVAAENIEGILRLQTIGHDDVILELANPAYFAAAGAENTKTQLEALEELCELVEAEARIVSQSERSPYRKGAAAFVAKVVSGGPELSADFHDAAEQLAVKVLKRAAQLPPSAGMNALLESLVQNVVAFRRYQSWSDTNAVYSRSYFIATSQTAWESRKKILKLIRDIILQASTPLGSRVALWKLLVEAHRNVNECRSPDSQESQPEVLTELLEDLQWALAVLESENHPLQELTAARGLWRWHYEFEVEPNLKRVSEDLERIYGRNEYTAEFEPLFGEEGSQERRQKILEKAAELAAASEVEKLSEFLERAVRFVGDRNDYFLRVLASELGESAGTNEVVRAFIEFLLAQSNPVQLFTEFGKIAAASWVAKFRKAGKTAEDPQQLVARLVSICNSDSRRIELLWQIYHRIWKPDEIGDLSRAEHEYLRTQSQFFLLQGKGSVYLSIVGQTIRYEWATLKGVVEKVLDETPQERITQSISSLIGAIYEVVSFSPASIGLWPVGVGPWLLDQLLRVADYDDLDATCVWRLDDIFRRLGRVPVAWLPGALERRKTMEQHGKDSAAFDAIGFRIRLSKYVTPIEASSFRLPEIEQAVTRLFDFLDDGGTIGFYLPEIFHDIDPEGLVVPAEVARKVNPELPLDSLRRVAKIGAAFGPGTESWRAIATSVLSQLGKHSDEERAVVYSGLLDRGFRTWSAKRGEIPDFFLSGVDEARIAVDNEHDNKFIDFWKWKLRVAEAELQEAVEQAKEDSE